MPRIKHSIVALAVVVLPSCGDGGPDTSGAQVYIETGAVDLATGFPASLADAAYPFWLDATDLPDGHVSEDNLRFVQWPSRELVAGDWQQRRSEPDDGRLVFRFEPTTPLSEGWYAMELRVPRYNYTFTGPDLSLGDGWIALRSRIGSQPTARLSVGENGEFMIQLSEDIVSDTDYDVLELVDYSIDGRPASCQSYGRDSYPLPAGAPFNGFAIGCDPMPEGATGELRFGEGLEARGRRLIDYRGQSPATWSVRPDLEGPEDTPDSYFSIRSDEIAP